ncbi:nucleotidyltransferase family protein [Moorella sulfitireducens]|uniref:nucleotidyltransferase family protein n=1 Tax=Neomoorella sulfitireducens TaxID=2972948 RepID=UPI0021AC6A07|nr:nucleotidyltransferase family protein [Moorella sulfitireducens]
MEIDAVVLAGDGGGRALLPVGSRPMIAWVVEALLASGRIRRLAVTGPQELAPVLPPDAILVPAGRTAVDSALNGAAAFPEAEWLLLVTADIPLLKPEAVKDFLDRCRERPADFYYPIVSRECNEAFYPGVKRTYVRLREGTFTGGNMVLIKAAALLACARRGQELVRLRKSPLALSRLAGFKFIVKFLTHRLTIAEAEKNFSRLLGARGAGIISPFPEIGIDVDKESDLELARRVLGDGPKEPPEEPPHGGWRHRHEQ